MFYYRFQQLRGSSSVTVLVSTKTKCNGEKPHTQIETPPKFRPAVHSPPQHCEVLRDTNFWFRIKHPDSSFVQIDCYYCFSSTSLRVEPGRLNLNVFNFKDSWAPLSRYMNYSVWGSPIKPRDMLIKKPTVFHSHYPQPTTLHNPAFLFLTWKNWTISSSFSRPSRVCGMSE